MIYGDGRVDKFRYDQKGGVSKFKKAMTLRKQKLQEQKK